MELHGRQTQTDDSKRGTLLDAYTLSDKRRLSTFVTPTDKDRLSAGSSAAGSSGYPSTVSSARVSATGVIFETDETETEITDTETETEPETDYERGK